MRISAVEAQGESRQFAGLSSPLRLGGRRAGRGPPREAQLWTESGFARLGHRGSARHSLGRQWPMIELGPPVAGADDRGGGRDMGTDGIFLITRENEMVEMTAAPFISEDDLQDLLARYPNLLPGRQINPS